MLAEILMVRLETALRMAQETPAARDPRFVPFTLAAGSELSAAASAPVAPDALTVSTNATQ